MPRTPVYRPVLEGPGRASAGWVHAAGTSLRVMIGVAIDVMTLTALAFVALGMAPRRRSISADVIRRCCATGLTFHGLDGRRPRPFIDERIRGRAPKRLEYKDA